MTRDAFGDTSSDTTRATDLAPPPFSDPPASTRAKSASPATDARTPLIPPPIDIAPEDPTPQEPFLSRLAHALRPSNLFAAIPGPIFQKEVRISGRKSIRGPAKTKIRPKSPLGP